MDCARASGPASTPVNTRETATARTTSKTTRLYTESVNLFPASDGSVFRSGLRLARLGFVCPRFMWILLDRHRRTLLGVVSLALASACGGAAPQARAHTQVMLADCVGIEACVAACATPRGSSCYAAGTMYETGAGAVQSYPKAAQFYAQACEAGEPRGCNDLGVMHEIGVGGGQDYAGAAALYDRACNAGDAQGCANLGLRYEEGLGVPRDHARAQQLRQQACSLGVQFACQK
jgi:hypothetical protein